MAQLNARPAANRSVPRGGFGSLREFLSFLKRRGELRCVSATVDPRLEVTEICQRTLKAAGPALLFVNPKGANVPLLGNLFGSVHRVALGMGRESLPELRKLDACSRSSRNRTGRATLPRHSKNCRDCGTRYALAAASRRRH